MKAIKKPIQGIVIAISVLVGAQSAFAGASHTLRGLCNNAAGGAIVEDMKITGYTESWTRDDPKAYIKNKDGGVYQIQYGTTTNAPQQHQVTVQGIAIAISALVISQSAFAKASDSLKRLCSNAAGGEIVNEVRLSSYIESWTGQNPESYIVIDSSSNIYANSNDGFTSLQLAATKGHTDIVSYLRGKRSAKEENLFSAIKTDYSFDRVMQIINQRVNVNARDNDNYTPLSWAASLGRLKVVEHLIKNDADIEAKDRDIWTPLHAAAYHGQLDMVKYLVEKGADFNAKGKNGKTPYNVASERGHSEIAEFLKPMEQGYTALRLAAENGRLDVVKYLIKRGADINTRDGVNRTPLHYAAESGHLYQFPLHNKRIDNNKKKAILK
ncbi:hypothetical protein TNCT_386701 [Trichonephila clavata]|uniref:Ankyrin repeat protein n=1 Tax=Trichonephila clavata TaxID=2740835 RepID=A0A8X6HP81_TRICU|nr:hypothetical protein TNCT_386701 [Trichonephila clavata]